MATSAIPWSLSTGPEWKSLVVNFWDKKNPGRFLKTFWENGPSAKTHERQFYSTKNNGGYQRLLEIWQRIQPFPETSLPKLPPKPWKNNGEYRTGRPSIANRRIYMRHKFCCTSAKPSGNRYLKQKFSQDSKKDWNSAFHLVKRLFLYICEVIRKNADHLFGQIQIKMEPLPTETESIIVNGTGTSNWIYKNQTLEMNICSVRVPPLLAWWRDAKIIPVKKVLLRGAEMANYKTVRQSPFFVS